MNETKTVAEFALAVRAANHYGVSDPLKLCLPFIFLLLRWVAVYVRSAWMNSELNQCFLLTREFLTCF